MCHLSDRDAKHLYLQLCHVVTSYKCEYFRVKLMASSLSRKVHFLLGVGPTSILLLDDESKEIVANFPIESLLDFQVETPKATGLFQFAAKKSPQLVLTFADLRESVTVTAEEATLATIHQRLTFNRAHMDHASPSRNGTFSGAGVRGLGADGARDRASTMAGEPTRSRLSSVDEPGPLSRAGSSTMLHAGTRDSRLPSLGGLTLAEKVGSMGRDRKTITDKVNSLSRSRANTVVGPPDLSPPHRMDSGSGSTTPPRTLDALAARRKVVGASQLSTPAPSPATSQPGSPSPGRRGNPSVDEIRQRLALVRESQSTQSSQSKLLVATPAVSDELCECPLAPVCTLALNFTTNANECCAGMLAQGRCRGSC